MRFYKISPQNSLNNLPKLVVFLFYQSFYLQFTTQHHISQHSPLGGLLGLFLGFSVISLIEIIYFLSLRPYCASKRESDSQRQPTDEENQFQSKHYNGLRGANNKTTLVGQGAASTYLNEYYMRSEMFQQKNAGERIRLKLLSVFDRIKARLMKAWNALVERYNERKDEGQAPYPFYN